jgi:tail lysozyme
VPESILEINIRLEQAQKELEKSLATVNRLEESIAKSSQRWGQYSSQVKATQPHLDKAASSAEKLWTQQARDLARIESIIKRLGTNIDSNLINSINKFGEAIDKAGSKFDTRISSQFIKMERDLKKLEETRKRAEIDPVIGPLQRFNAKRPSTEELGLTSKQPWRQPKVEERERSFSEHVKKFFTQRKDSGQKGESHFVNNLGNAARVGMSASGGGAHYGMISGMTGLLKSFFLQPTGLQMIETIAAGALLATGTAIALAEPVSRRAKRGRDYGMGYGAVEAAEYTMGPYMDVGAALGASRAAQDPTSQQYIAMRQLGLGQGADLGEQNKALKEYMGHFQDFGTFLATLHNTPLGSLITDERAFNIHKMSPEQIAANAAETKRNTELTAMDPGTAAIYTHLNTDLQVFGLTIENVTAKSLTGFATWIDKFLVNSETNLSAWSNAVNKGTWTQNQLNDANKQGLDTSKALWDKFKTWQNTGAPDIKGNTPTPSITDEVNKAPKASPSWGGFKDWMNSGPNVPKFATGAYNVPDTGYAMLHQNELVMPEKEASAFRDMLKGSTSEGSKDFGEFNKQLMESSNIIIDLNKQMKPLADSMERANDNFLKGVSGLGPNTVGGGGEAPPSGGPARAGASEAGELSGSGGGGGNIPNAGNGRTRSSGGGGSGPSGAGGGKSVARGTLKTNQKEAYQAAIQAGLSKDSASALVANMSGEALSKPGDLHWDVSHWARGIVQWDPQRSAAIKAQFGKFPNEMSVGEQTKAAIWEMKTNPTYKKTWAALQGTGSVESKVSTLVSDYERPANKQKAYNERMGYYKGLGNLEGPSEAVKSAAESYGPKTKQQIQAEDTRKQPMRPSSPTPHIGDMSQYHKDSNPNLTIFNKSGSNVNLQTASIGAAQGNFSS